VQAGEKTLQDFVDSALEDVRDIGQIYDNAVDAVRQKGERFIREMEQQMRSGWGWFAYMPPEARGAMIASITEIANQPQYAGNRELRQMAAFSVDSLLATTQTRGHLDNTLDRITTAMGELGNRSNVVAMNDLLDGSSFAGGLDRASVQVAKAEPMIQRPFMRNDDPSFAYAQFPLSHPSAQA
jgi:hypothetical protein